MNLQYWRDPQKISRRVAREVLELADYDIEIHHLKGSANGQADTLSRQPDFDQGEGDNEGVVVLPNTLFPYTTLFRSGSPHRIKVFSDHMNLQYWRDPQKISRRVAREVLELADYDIEIHHLKGSANGQADALSRRSDFDQGEGDNEGVIVLPDTLFARSTRPEGREEQDEDIQ